MAYGFNIERNILSKAERFTSEGVEFIDPIKLPKGVKNKYMAMISGETLMAVPEGDAGIQALMTQSVKQGTLPGEALRMATQFKIFPVSIMANHWQRVANKNVKAADRFAYAATSVVGLTLMGILSVQTRDFINGKESRSLDDIDLWIDGFIQGGAGSLVADLMVPSIGKETRFGGSEFGDFIGGPMGGDIQNLLFDVAFGNVNANLFDKNNAKGLDQTAVKFLEAATPNFWPTKLLLQRAMLDPLNDMADPKWRSKQAKKRTKMRRDQGRDYWSKPGEFYK